MICIEGSASGRGDTAIHMMIALVPIENTDSPHNKQCALIFSRRGVREKLMLNFFARANQLTRREEEILDLLCEGHTAPKIAQIQQLQESTVRTHLRNILNKTHTKSIRELVKNLAMLPPMMTSVAVQYA